MKKRKISKDIFLLALLTAITVFIWIGLSLYHSLAKKEIPKVLQSQIRPLNPNLDEQTLESLKSRKTFTWEEIGRNLND